jgi:hypothetical protein
MNATQSIVLGVISGVFASGIVYLAVLFFNKVVIPWYREVIYSSIDISGTWKS